MRAAGRLVLGFFLAASGVADAERLPVQVFTMADGLAHDRVKSIMMDSRGLLWFGSATGVDWFDGRRFAGHTFEEGLARSTDDMLDAPDHTCDGLFRLDANGVGFNGRAVAAGHGLGNLQARAVTLRGRLDIHSTPDRGPSVRLRLPRHGRRWRWGIP